MPNLSLVTSAMERKPHDPRDPLVLDREAPVYEPPTPEDWDRLEVYQGLSTLLEKYGAKRVMTIVRTLAALNGEEV